MDTVVAHPRTRMTDKNLIACLGADDKGQREEDRQVGGERRKLKWP